MDDMRSVLTMAPNQMGDWKEICEAFAELLGVKLLFVNETSCGIETADGQLCHLYVEEVFNTVEQMIALRKRGMK